MEADLKKRGKMRVQTANEPSEHFELSKAMYQAGVRLKRTAFQQQARQVIDRLLSTQGPHPPDAYFLQGQIARGLDDLSAAEAQCGIARTKGRASVFGDRSVAGAAWHSGAGLVRGRTRRA